MQIAKQVDYFNGTLVMMRKEVKMSDKAEDMRAFDLEYERVTILNHRERIRQAEAMGEFRLSEVLRKNIAQEPEHRTELEGALGIDHPSIEGTRSQRDFRIRPIAKVSDSRFATARGVSTPATRVRWG